MKILVVGSGGREHALVWSLNNSCLTKRVFVAPGNAGTHGLNVNIKADDIEALKDFAINQEIDLVVVGPEAPLVLGIVDEFNKIGIPIIGPSQAAAQLEGSKCYTKLFCSRAQIPTADFFIFENAGSAKYCISQRDKFPVVIKADGLAAGKGVIICKNKQEAFDAIDAILVDNKFGMAGNKIVIEDFLKGEEASYIVLVDKNGNILPLASSQDHKKIGERDTGLNTGGMGAYSPAPVVTDEVEEKAMNRIIRPTVEAMAKEGKPFTGFLYAGLMIDLNNDPYLVEFNVRLGDPEAQAVLMRLQSDLSEIFMHAHAGSLDEVILKWKDKPAVCVVMSAGGYPESYEKGKVINGISYTRGTSMVFHAGTSLNESAEVITAGGRVLGVTALGNDFQDAINNAYSEVSKIHWEDCFFRKDIGYKAVNR